MSVWNGSQFIIQSDGSATQTYTASSGVETYLLKQNNLSDVPNRNTARENLGITVSLIPPSNPQLNDIWVDLDE